MENSAEKTKRQKTIDLRQKRQQDILLEKFREKHNVSLACKKTGIPKANYYRWRINEEFALRADEALQEGKDTTNDAVESALIRKALDGNVSAMKLYLMHNHKTYYTDQLSLEKEERDGAIKKIKETLKMITGMYRKNSDFKGNSRDKVTNS